MLHSPQTTRDACIDVPGLAVILAAGEGSRLACHRNGTPKPALKLLGLSLAERTITTCNAAGIHRFLVVLGHEADQVQAHYQEITARRQCEIKFVIAEDWKLGNGASLLPATDTDRSHVGSRGWTFSDISNIELPTKRGCGQTATISGLRTTLWLFLSVFKDE